VIGRRGSGTVQVISAAKPCAEHRSGVLSRERRLGNKPIPSVCAAGHALRRAARCRHAERACRIDANGLAAPAGAKQRGSPPSQPAKKLPIRKRDESVHSAIAPCAWQC
jgi:hypothetical protein